MGIEDWKIGESDRLCRPKQKLGLTRKKTWYSSQAGTERVQKLKVEYWEKLRNIETQNKHIFRRNSHDALVWLEVMPMLLWGQE
ncbi:MULTISPECIES: hypothetical protein [unclassified Microcoleus]|uniref:hypothetical protein n=1 Tax=unclassified Microcoleus TaxID=2642155 RepID=UPI002FD055F7